MVKTLPLDDFRAIRRVLEPDDFAISDGPDPPPTDLIDAEMWHDLMNLADHVAIRTTDRFGTLIRYLIEDCHTWIDAIDIETVDYLNVIMMDCLDEFYAAVFNGIHGYYRQAIASMRNAVELCCIGAHCQLNALESDFADWRAGRKEVKFGHACDMLRQAAPVSTLETYLESRIKDSLFRQKSPTGPGGWVRRLYAELSDYLHSRPRFSNADLWQSNGPIFVPKAFGFAAEFIFETSALCFLIVKMGRPGMELPEPYLGLPNFTKHRWKRVCISGYSFAKTIM